MLEYRYLIFIFNITLKKKNLIDYIYTVGALTEIKVGSIYFHDFTIIGIFQKTSYYKCSKLWFMAITAYPRIEYIVVVKI